MLVTFFLSGREVFVGLRGSRLGFWGYWLFVDERDRIVGGSRESSLRDLLKRPRIC
jgi:hypothetical protein